MGHHRTLASVFVSGAAFLSSVIPIPHWADVPGPLAHQPAWEAVPFTLHRDHIVLVKASVGSLRNLVFVVDTGTTRTVLDLAVVRKLGLAGTADRITVFDREMAAERVLLPALHAGPLQASDIPVLATDFAPLARALGLRPAGILGMDVLGQACLRIDFRERKLLVGTQPALRESSSLHVRPPLVTVEGSFGGRAIRLLVDTGANAVVLFPSALTHLEANWPVDAEVEAVQLAGPVRLQRLRAGRLTIGTETFDNLPVFLLDTKGQQFPHDGVLGMRALQARTVQLDMRTRSLSWTR
jgi:predicted aspartyl protease